ncbi:RNA polymerase subunit sigma-70 [Phytoactinopolyspora endophytica]|uniref:RNA polymerase subunit sigma-70 n=1 Tax=Phytoactinopolyspora endophytica TaxID=1642495 RepID=UPI00101C3888|nr:RNA polymerase subunit sigma-70 [Phytoactinopolyspora endophytica]
MTADDEQGDEDLVAAATREGDEAAFGRLAERYRGELRVHCYRMLGSYDEAEDLVQETMLRAWRSRATYRGPSTFRAWLYRIATNACLDLLKRHRRPTVAGHERTSDGHAPIPPVAVPWLQPFPDELLEPLASSVPGADAAVVSRETFELTFLTAIQLLPPRQRAVLILRDVVGWSAQETAETLDVSVASVNSALQRARPAVRDHLPKRRTEWSAPSAPTDDERAVLRRYMEAIERADDDALATLLRDDVRVGHQPWAGGHMEPTPGWYSGRETVIAGWAPILHVDGAPEMRMLPTSANRQPALASYIRAPGEPGFEPFALAVLRMEDGLIAEMSVFHADTFPLFGLPESL